MPNQSSTCSAAGLIITHSGTAAPGGTAGRASHGTRDPQQREGGLAGRMRTCPPVSIYGDMPTARERRHEGHRGRHSGGRQRQHTDAAHTLDRWPVGLPSWPEPLLQLQPVPSLPPSSPGSTVTLLNFKHTRISSLVHRASRLASYTGTGGKFKNRASRPATQALAGGEAKALERGRGESPRPC